MKADTSGFAFASRSSDVDPNTRVTQSLAEDNGIPSRRAKKLLDPLKSPTAGRLAVAPRSRFVESDLVEVIEPQRRANDLILDQDNFRILTEIVQEVRSSQDLRRHGLKPRAKLLFCGPPGCGKTLCAEVLAYELKLPLVAARLDGIVTTYLGETASNLRKVFDAAVSAPSVLFLDEFDALARARTEATEHNEIRRVVNSLLMMIEGYTGRGLLIAATNFESSIDRAAWRRFDEVLLFSLPDEAQIRRTLRLKTRNYSLDFDPMLYASSLEGMSYAEIERICQNAIKRSILDHKKAVSTQAFERAVADERRRMSIRKDARESG